MECLKLSTIAALVLTIPCAASAESAGKGALPATIVQDLVDSITKVCDSDAEKYVELSNDHELLFRTFLISAGHLPRGKVRELLATLYLKSPGSTDWIEFGESYLGAFFDNGEGQPVGGTRDSKRNDLINSLSTHILASRQASAGRVQEAVESYKSAKVAQKSPDIAVEYYPFYSFVLQSSNFGSIVEPPAFAIGKSCVLSHQDESAELLLSDMDQFERFFVLSGMSSGYARLGDTVQATTSFNDAMDSLTQYSLGLNWYPQSSYGRKHTIEWLCWLTSVHAYQLNERAFALGAEKLEKLCDQLDSSNRIYYLSHLAFLCSLNMDKDLSARLANRASRDLSASDGQTTLEKAETLTILAATYTRLNMQKESSATMEALIHCDLPVSELSVLYGAVWEHTGRYWFESGVDWPRFRKQLEGQHEANRIRLLMGYLGGLTGIGDRQTLR